mgnify:CR=1 FL=1
MYFMYGNIDYNLWMIWYLKNFNNADLSLQSDAYKQQPPAYQSVMLLINLHATNP